MKNFRFRVIPRLEQVNWFVLVWKEGAFQVFPGWSFCFQINHVKFLACKIESVSKGLTRCLPQVNIPFIVALRNPGMRDRHWKKLSDILGFEVALSPTFNVSHAVTLGLPKHIQVIDEVNELLAECCG